MQLSFSDSPAPAPSVRVRMSLAAVSRPPQTCPGFPTSPRDFPCWQACWCLPAPARAVVRQASPELVFRLPRAGPPDPESRPVPFLFPGWSDRPRLISVLRSAVLLVVVSLLPGFCLLDSGSMPDRSLRQASPHWLLQNFDGPLGQPARAAIPLDRSLPCSCMRFPSRASVALASLGRPKGSSRYPLTDALSRTSRVETLLACTSVGSESLNMLVINAETRFARSRSRVMRRNCIA